jgi:hypothetical protein
MATRVVLVDDIDGTEEAETVPFAIDGKSYEIDLSEKNRAALMKALDRYVKAGRRTGTSRRRSKPADLNPETRKAIREWANANGWNLSSKGRIPADAIEAWHNS